jgi:hypothetical protein
MRKVDIVIVLAVVALGAAAWQQKPVPVKAPTAAPTHACTPDAMTTSSGRWTVLPARYQLAGLSIGMSETEIVARLGQPADKNVQNSESSTWTYASDGAELHLAMLEGRLIMIGGTGRWALTEGDRSLPGFQSSQAQIEATFGQPDRRDAPPTAWVYTRRPGELTFHFDQGRVSQVVVTGEIAPQKLAPR